MNRVNVLCIKWGTKYGAEYVNKLRSMVGRHLGRPFRFVCLTDDTEGITPGIECRPIPAMQLGGSPWYAGWRKLAVFAPELHDLEGRVLFFDLDVVIVAPEGVADDWWAGQFASIAAFTPTSADEPDREGRTRIVSGSVQAFISLEGIVDVEAERVRLSKAIADAEGVLAKAQAKLANENFVSRAPADVVDKERAKADELEARVGKLRAQLEELG